MSKFSKEKLSVISMAIGVGLILLFVFLDVLQGKENGFGFAQFLGAGVGMVLVLVSGAVYSPKLSQFLGRNLIILFSFLFILGMALLVINLAGLFIPLRSPAISEGVDFFGKVSRPRYSVQDVTRLQDKRPDETVQEYAYRLNKLVNDSTLQLPDERGKYPQYDLRVPIQENYIFWLLSYLQPARYGYYQYCDAEKAIERAVTTCGQATRIIKYIWNENDMKARRVTLDGHIIVEVQIDQARNIWWVLDPLFGIVFESDMKTLSRQTDLVRNAFEKAGYPHDVAMKNAEIFNVPGNYVITEKTYCNVEEKYYLYKWVLPLIFILPYGVRSLVRSSRGLRRKS